MLWDLILLIILYAFKPVPISGNVGNDHLFRYFWAPDQSNLVCFVICLNQSHF